MAELDSIFQDKDDGEARYGPRFELAVNPALHTSGGYFDLGWTVERFGDFDRMVNWNDHGDRQSKPERIGKKYQWIAYHEILAYIADHYQYRERFSWQT